MTELEKNDTNRQKKMQHIITSWPKILEVENRKKKTAIVLTNACMSKGRKVKV